MPMRTLAIERESHGRRVADAPLCRAPMTRALKRARRPLYVNLGARGWVAIERQTGPHAGIGNDHEIGAP